MNSIPVRPKRKLGLPTIGVREVMGCIIVVPSDLVNILFQLNYVDIWDVAETHV
jgi:hypothetical protein